MHSPAHAFPAIVASRSRSRGRTPIRTRALGGAATRSAAGARRDESARAAANSNSEFPGTRRRQRRPRPGAAVAAGDGDRVVEQPHQEVRARRLEPVALRGIVFELEGDQPAEVLQQRPVVDRAPRGRGHHQFPRSRDLVDGVVGRGRAARRGVQRAPGRQDCLGKALRP